jgi:hypothetical protein
MSQLRQRHCLVQGGRSNHNCQLYRRDSKKAKVGGRDLRAGAGQWSLHILWFSCPQEHLSAMYPLCKLLFGL